MTFTNISIRHPIFKSLQHSISSIQLIVKGQGVFIFDNKDNNKECIFYIYNNDKSDGYKIVLNKSSVTVLRISDHSIYIDKKNNSGLVDKVGAYYWFSIDSQNQTLRLGIGEARMETMIYNFTFIFQNNQDRIKNKLFMETLDTIQISQYSNNLVPLRILRDPVTIKMAMLVKNTEDLTMDDVANGRYLPKSNLSLASQQLFDCISGKNFKLDDDDFPEFSQAIEYSIKTPGCWCCEKLKDKSTEFSKDKPNILETYLRITLGQNTGESPGIPYVMEIWPIGHYSPVHNHSGANAIIRVLNGEINVSQFPYLCLSKDGVKPFNISNFHKDQITWISPTLNQTHQLKNLETNSYTCITIQCYMYDEKDKLHYDYFDYIDNNYEKKQYEPYSDMDFFQFKTLIKNEWYNLKKN